MTVEKLTAVPKAKVGAVIGAIDEAERLALDRLIALVLGLGERELAAP